jgi:zinc transport system substrate-binding protein
MLLATSAVSCSQDETTTDKIGVAVTIVPQTEFVERIGGDRVEVTVMVPPGASPHTYEPTPSQMVDLAEAEMYAKVGSGIEFELVWMDKLIAQNEDMLVVDCAEGVTLQETTTAHEHEDEHEDEHEHEENDEHEHGTMDPHIWLSVVNAQIMVENITDGLIQIDPDNRAYYEDNRDTYLEELSQLDQEIRDGLAPVKNRMIIVYHHAFGYFASDYDLTILPVEAEGKEATAAGLQIVIDMALEHDIRVVFASPQFDTRQAEVIAEAIGGRVGLINPLAENYVENMYELMGELVGTME